MLVPINAKKIARRVSFVKFEHIDGFVRRWGQLVIIRWLTLSIRQYPLILYAIETTNLSQYHLHVVWIVLELTIVPAFNTEGEA